MESQAPSQEEYRHLYELAAALKQEAPWEWMTEDQIFGVRNPETGQVGYVSLMGMRGEHLALALYLGSEGLDGFWRMERGEEEDNPAFLLEVPQLQASFEDREMLEARDFETIKALGLKFRGRQAWPRFRSIVPGYMFWHVTAAEARFLATAMEQTLDVTRRLKQNPALLDPPVRGRYLVRTRTDEGWTDEWFTPPPPSVHARAPLDEQRLAAVRRQFPQQQATWEVDLFAIPTVIKEPEDPRPYLPYGLLVVEGQYGLVLGIEMLVPKPTLNAVWDQALPTFLGMIARAGYVPRQVLVAGKRVRHLLAPAAERLGIELKLVRRLPALEEARSGMEQLLSR